MSSRLSEVKGIGKSKIVVIVVVFYLRLQKAFGYGDPAVTVIKVFGSPLQGKPEFSFPYFYYLKRVGILIGSYYLSDGDIPAEAIKLVGKGRA